MALTYTQIASTTVTAGGGATDIQFNNIPSFYTDLIVKISGRSTTAAAGANRWRDIGTNINAGGINANMTALNLYGLGGGSVGANTGTNTTGGAVVDLNSTSNTFSVIETYYANYTSTLNKAISGVAVTENNGTTSLCVLWSSLWSNTGTINSLVFVLDSGNFAQHSTATLYGIKNTV